MPPSGWLFPLLNTMPKTTEHLNNTFFKTNSVKIQHMKELNFKVNYFLKV